ncbi:MAG: glycosyltransferase [Pirellulales bacterium]|nr:glycosyltransferase [Pirellulales bacterium]
MADIVSSSVNTPITVPTVVPQKGSATTTCRVLHVINGEYYAGAERVQDLLAQELPQFGFEIGFACVKPDQFPQVRQTKDAPLHALPMRGRFDLDCVRRLAELIRNEDYKMVHAHTPRSVWVGSMAARRAAVPLVYHLHSPTAKDSTRRLQNFLNARLERWSIRRAARLIAVSPSLKQSIQQAGFAEERVVYVPNGVPSLAVPPRKKPTGTWTLGMTALFRPRKGVEILLAALAALRSRGVDVRLRAVGAFETRDYEREVKRLAARLAVDDAIHWTGFTRDIAAELRLIDVFVLPSLFGEGLPMVVLEAMAAGLPVVASRVEGIPAAIRHREDGLLVEPACANSLARALEELVAGESLDYSTLSHNARRRHAECFSAHAMARGVAEIYREVMDEER